MAVSETSNELTTHSSHSLVTPGSMVNERVGSSDWSDGGELGETWASRNAFSYGRGGEKGTARPEVRGLG